MPTAGSVGNCRRAQRVSFSLLWRLKVPHALDKQFLIVGDPVSLNGAEANLDGRPVIAEGSDHGRYFKRLPIDADTIILENFEIGDDFPPILLAETPGLSTHLTQVPPVLGVMFETP
jgi:hypothetical protein